MRQDLPNGRDIWLDRIALGTLALVMLLGGAGMTCLAWVGQQTPHEIVALVSAAGGVLLGWFGRARNGWPADRRA